MPEFHERDSPATRRVESGQVLAGELELEEIDTDSYQTVTNQTPTSKLRESQPAS